MRANIIPRRRRRPSPAFLSPGGQLALGFLLAFAILAGGGLLLGWVH